MLHCRQQRWRQQQGSSSSTGSSTRLLLLLLLLTKARDQLTHKCTQTLLLLLVLLLTATNRPQGVRTAPHKTIASSNINKCTSSGL